MKTHPWLILFFALTIAGGVLLVMAYLYYLRPDLQTYAFLTSDPTLGEVKQKMGTPHEIVLAGRTLPERGWPISQSERNMDVWIYYTRTGIAFYLYIDHENQRLGYVFSSSS